MGSARSGGVEDFVEVGAVNQVGRTAKKLDGGLFTKRALRPENRHALRGFERQASRHDLAPDGGDVFVLEWAGVGLGDFVDDLRHAIGPEEGRAFGAFDLAHLLCHMGALVQQAQQLVVQRVNLHTQSAQGVRLNGLLAHVRKSFRGPGSGLFFFKFAHVSHQRLHTFEGHGVVNAGAHATH